MPTKPEPTVEELASTYVKDRAETLRGLKKITAILVGVALTACLVSAVLSGINLDVEAARLHFETMDEGTSSAWLYAFILVTIGAAMVGHRFGYRIASRALDTSNRGRTRLVYGGLLVVVFAGLTPLLPLQATFLGIAASVFAAQFEPKQAGAE